MSQAIAGNSGSQANQRAASTPMPSTAATTNTIMQKRLNFPIDAAFLLECALPMAVRCRIEWDYSRRKPQRARLAAQKCRQPFAVLLSTRTPLHVRRLGKGVRVSLFA